MPTNPALTDTTPYADERFEEIGQAIIDQALAGGMKLEEVQESYGLDSGSSTSDIGYQAVQWGDANMDGSLN